jgi:hypothetical protein
VPLHAVAVATLRKHRIARMEARLAAAMWLESGIHLKPVADLFGHYSTSRCLSAKTTSDLLETWSG